MAKTKMPALQPTPHVPAASASVPISWHEERDRADDLARDELARVVESRRVAFAKQWQAKDRAEGRDSKTRATRLDEAWEAHADKPTALSPAIWLEVRHRKAQWPCWTDTSTPSRQPLPKTLPFDETALELAALNCGYGMGRERITDPYLGDGVWADRRFAKTMRLRTEFLLSTIDFQGGKLHSFMKWHETTEKGDVSFLIGGAAASIVAGEWLRSGGRKMEGFWHYRLYSAALLAGNTREAFKNVDIKSKGKTPDYIVVDDHRDVHLFEAKGGAENDNHQVLKDGLLQLAGVSTVTLCDGSVAGRTVKPKSRVAVRTVVEPDKPFSVLVYDPPSGQRGLPLEIDRSVARALQALESARLFEGMRSPVSQLRTDMFVRAFAGTHLVMCADAGYDHLEEQLRAYFRIKAALPDKPVAAVDLEPRESGEPAWKAATLKRSLRKLPRLHPDARTALEKGIEQASSPSLVLPFLCAELGIPALAEKVQFVALTALLAIRRSGGKRLDARILPGGLLQLIGWDGREIPWDEPRPSPPRKI